MKIQRYFKSNEEFVQYKNSEIIDYVPCINCGVTGFLNWHGPLKNKCDKKKGHRILCSKKGNCDGCGHTFSVYYSVVIINHNICAVTLWNLLSAVLENIPVYLIPLKKGIMLSITSAYRLWNKFKLNQSHIRSYITRITSPPKLSKEKLPEIQCITHLKSAFSEGVCPIADFQYKFQISFFNF